MVKVKDFTVESFRRGYCERYIIQAVNIIQAKKIAWLEYSIDTDMASGNGYFVF